MLDNTLKSDPPSPQGRSVPKYGIISSLAVPADSPPLPKLSVKNAICTYIVGDEPVFHDIEIPRHRFKAMREIHACST